MSDMRNFTPSNDVSAQSAFVDSGVMESHETIKETYVLEDSGGLGGFHQAEVEEDGAGRNKVIGALVLALMLGTAGVYAYSTMMPANDVVADENVKPVAAKTAAIAPMTPPAATTPAGDSMATAPTDTAMSEPARPQTAMSAPDVVKPAARTTQERVANAPRVTPLAAAPSPAIIAPPQQASVVPEPVSPTPPASALAGNPPLNEQSAPVEANPVTPTAPAEAAPAAQPEPAQPAPVDQSQ